MSGLGAFDASDLGAFLESAQKARGISVIENEYVCITHSLNIVLCTTSRTMSLNSFYLLAPFDLVADAGDYIVRGGVEYDSITVNYRSAFSFLCCATITFTGWQATITRSTPYIVPGGLTACDLVNGDIEWRRSDGSIKYKWSPQISDRCYTFEQPCAGFNERCDSRYYIAP